MMEERVKKGMNKKDRKMNEKEKKRGRKKRMKQEREEKGMIYNHIK